MPPFIKGRVLCERFFLEEAKPILDRFFPGLRYTAGLVGYGSDVLGYDDETSTDHMWGPRFYLFLAPDDFPRKGAVMEAFRSKLPCRYKGYSVNFSAPDPEDGGVRHPEPVASGPVDPLIFIHTPEEYLDGYLGCHDFTSLTAVDWLSFSEHRLLALTAGKFFADDLHLGGKLRALAFYPEDVRLYLLASNWSLAAQEQAFVRRCADVGDETGSALAAARIAERLMRLAFLYCRQYAPYSKWFGTAFSRLPVGEDLKEAIRRAVTAREIGEREDAIVRAQVLAAELHNRCEPRSAVEIRVQPYFGRRIKVIFCDRIASALRRRLEGTAFAAYPPVGTLSGIANFTDLFDDPARRESVKGLYRG